jgi:non-ribosomal peptide synthetase component F/acyl carrier protein
VPAQVRIALDAATAQSVLLLAGEDGRTLESLLLTCWAGMLSAIWGLDVVVGVGCDGRNYPELADAIGPYARYLPIRPATRGNDSIARLASITAKELAEHRQWQEYAPWPRSVSDRASAADRAIPFALDVVDASATPQAREATFSVAGWSMDADNCQLRLTATRTRDALCLAIDYDPACYSAAEAATMSEQFAAQLKNLERDISLPFNPQSMRTGRDRMIGAEHSDRSRALAPRQCLHQLAEDAADRAPDDTAIRCGRAELSYGELERRANQLARALQARGVGRSQLVGICLPGGFDAAISQLAVLKAGAAVLPLDPAWPAERLNQVLACFSPTALIAVTAGITFAAGSMASLACLDPMAGANMPEDRIASGVSPADLAYVSLRPGPDATALGAASSHLGLVNTVLALNQRLAVDSRTRLLAVAPPSTCSSVYDLFGPLAAGGAACYAPELDLSDLAGWVRAVQEHEATMWSSAPTLFDGVVDNALEHSGAGMRSLSVALLYGERPPTALPQRTAEVAPGLRIEHLYSVAEASICWVSTELAASPEQPRPTVGGTSTIGDQRCHVLDGQLNPCPAGVPGQIAIGGPGVGPGYLGSPGLTAQRFVPDPFSPVGERLYLTGDLGFLRPDGSLRYLGNLDHQPEAGLGVLALQVTEEVRRHPAVRQAVTLVSGRGAGALVSYVAGDITADQLSFYLAERLPRDIWPKVVKVPAWPLTGNGRTDLNALAQPGAARAFYVAPSNPLEDELIAMSTELLEAEQIGMHDNFFRLGGHSLQLAQLAGLITDHFEVEIPLQDLFEADNFEAMAHLILNAQLVGVDADEYAAIIADLAAGQEN